MTFRNAVEQGPEPVSMAYQPGKQALKHEHRALVDTDQPRRFRGSIDLDTALQNTVGFQNATRWDYGIGFQEQDGSEAALWVEVHPANTGEVDAVLRKLQWLKDFLSDRAPALLALTRPRNREAPYFWIATPAGVHILKNSPQYRRLAAAGLSLPRRRLDLR